MRFKEVLKRVHVSLTHLAQHPARGFVDEVMGMAEQLLSDAERVGVLMVAYELQRGDDGYALLPKVAALDLAVEQTVRRHCAAGKRMEKEFTKDIRRAQVHQVPVVGLAGVAQIELCQLLSLHSIAFLASMRYGLLHFLHEQQETAEPHFMPLAVKKPLDFRKADRAFCRLNNTSCLRHFQSKELFALAILPLAALEEAHQYLSLLLIAHGFHGFDDFRCLCNPLMFHVNPTL